jgi:hypothetical protein
MDDKGKALWAARQWEESARKTAGMKPEAASKALGKLARSAPAVFWAWGAAYPDRALRLARSLEAGWNTPGALAALICGTAYLAALGRLDGKLPFSMDVFVENRGEAGAVEHLERMEDVGRDADWPRREDENTLVERVAQMAFSWIAPASDAWAQVKKCPAGGHVEGLEAMEQGALTSAGASFAKALDGVEYSAMNDCQALSERLALCREEDALRESVPSIQSKAGPRL